MEEERSAWNWLIERWSAKLVEILESMTDQRPSAVWDANETAGTEVPADSLVWAQTLSLSPEPAIWIAAPQPVWEDIGGRTLRAAGIEVVEPADARNTWLEILNQSLAALAREIGTRVQRDVVCEKGDEAPGVSPEAFFVPLQVDYGDGTLPPLFVAFSPALIAVFQAAAVESAVAAADNAGDPADLPVPHPGLQAASISKTFDLLLDVGLPVTISFGRTQLQIRDVLKLTTGSIVELNRSVTEPVEVIVNDCVIARGEVVVVEGNYGVRIRHIISRQDRWRTGTSSAHKAQKGSGNAGEGAHAS